MKKILPTTISLLLFLLLQGVAISKTNSFTAQSILCDPITDGGTISSNQTGVPGGFDPALIVNTNFPTGGTGVIEYKWMKSTVPVPNTPGNPYWTDIPGATAQDYNPGFITQTTYYIRVSKRNTCYNWGEQSNMVKMTVPSAPVNSCLLYAVQDKNSSDYSQIFTVDVFNGNTVSNLGPHLDGWDIEGMEVDKNTGILYATSGNDNQHGFDGYFYSIDALTGNLNIIGHTGYDDVVSLAFHPVTNVLYAWVDDYGLITINTNTGVGTMVFSSPLDFDGMAWSIDGSVLYVATDDKELSTFDPVTGNINILTNTLPGPVESLEMRPDGKLMFGTHLASTTIYTIDPQTLAIVSSSNIITPYDDIESIVWPDWCSLSISINHQVNDVLCYGDNSGQVSLAGIGGVAPYTYSWNTGASVSNASNLSAGTYTVTVTDANGVSDSVTFTVNEPAATLSNTLQTTQATCGGNLADGSISTLVAGGTAPYSYLWSNGDTTASVSGLNPGAYSVTITDANGCSFVDTSSIATMCCNVTSAGAITGAQSNCGSFDPAPITSVSLPSGGVGTIEYIWLQSLVNVPNTVGNPHWTMIPGSTSATYDPGVLTQTTYFIRCARTSTCTFYAGESNVIAIEVNPTVTASISSSTNASCHGTSTGSVTANAAGGTAPFTYAWSNGATTVAITNLAAGTYTVTATDSKGCDATAQVTITEPTVLTVSSVVNANVLINGGSNGEVAASANGGTPAYTYAWSNGATTSTISNLTAGTYTVTVTDANGCTAVATSTVTEPTALTSSAVVNNNVDCNGNANGSATASASGAVTPYTYAWSNGASTATINGLSAGTYSVTVTDANGATSTNSVTITEPTALTASSVVNANVLINGGSNGEVTASANGGTPAYTYAWSTGATTSTISNLTAGTYTVTVTDANGCTAVATSTVTEPTVLTSSALVNNHVDCNGHTNGSATVSASGAVAPYTYAWSNGATTATITNLAAGTYTVTVTDANGATSTSSVTITEPTALTASSVVNANVLINGGSNGEVAASANGGTPAYTYAWNTGATTATISGLTAGTYIVTVTDANGCTAVATSTVTEPTALTSTAVVNNNVDCNGNANGSATVSASGAVTPYSYAWSNGASTATINGLSAGTYSVTVTDANGATSTNSVTITEPTALTATSTVNANVLINGGSNGEVTASANGGTPAYYYAWNTGSTTATISNLTAGTYTVTVTDANGCTAVVTSTITEPSELTSTAVVNNHVDCNGNANGSATASASGAVTPYSYAWSNGATTATITSLAAGTYSVTVTDANGATSTSSVTITEPTALTASSVVNANVLINGGSNGEVTASANGGTPAYYYAWSTGATTSIISNLTAGTYTVTVTDANGCTAVETSTVTEPTALTSTVVVNNHVDCNGNANGSATASASGAVTPYSYAWSNGATTATITSLAAGTYSVTVTDANGATSTSSVTITEPNILSATVQATQATCGGNLANGSMNTVVSGGTAPFTYTWSNGSTGSTINSLVPGTYSVIVTDANGCTAIGSNTIATMCCNVTSAGAITGSQSNCGSFDPAPITSVSLPSGGVGTIEYIWLKKLPGQSYTVIPGANGPTYDPGVITQTTKYRRCARRSNCTTYVGETNWITMTVHGGVTANIVSYSNVMCNGASNGNATVNATGSAPFTYAWSNGGTTATLSNLSAGTYSVTVTDVNGCTGSTQVTITEPNVLSATVQATQATCGGNLANGSMNTVVSGGMAPFTYTWSNGSTGSTINSLVPGTYSVTVTDVNGCTTIGSNTIATMCCNVTSAGAITGAQSNCGSFDPAPITSVSLPSGGVGTVEYIWLQSHVNVPNTVGNPHWTMIPGSTSATYDPGVLTQTTYFIRCARTSTCTNYDGESNIIAIEINNVGPSVNLTQVIPGCSNEMFEAALGFNVFVKGNVTVKTNETEGAMALGGNLTLAGNYTLAGHSTGTFKDQGDAKNSALVVGGKVIYSSQSGMNVVNSGFVKICNVTGSNIHDWDNQNNQPQNTRISAGNQNSNPRINLSIHQSEASINKCPIDFDDAFTKLEATSLSLSQCSNTLSMISTGPNRKKVTLTQGTKNVLNVNWNDIKDLQEFKFVNQPNATSSLLVNVDANGANVYWNVPNFPGIGDQHGQYIIWNFYNTSKITMTGGGTLKGTLLAPKAKVIDNNSGNIDGQLIAKSFYHNGGEMHNYLFTGNITGCATAVCTTAVTGPISICANSTVTIKADGGSAYAWSTGAITAQTTLGVGTHTVTVTNSNGCHTTKSVVVNSYQQTNVQFDVTDVTCNGNSDGEVLVNSVTGVGPYTYKWSNGSTSDHISNLIAGTYSVTITNNAGCELVKQVVVNEPNAIQVSSVVMDNSCNSGNTSCEFDLSNYSNGEVMSGNYNSLGFTLTSVANSGSLHDLIIFDTDLSNTRDSDLEVDQGNILIFPENNVDNNNDGLYDLPDDTRYGGKITFTFVKTRKVISFDFIDKDGGPYGTAKAYDANNNLIVSKNIVNMGDGSIQTISMNATGVKKLVINYTNSGGVGNFKFDCDENPLCDGAIDLTINGGTAPYTYNWSNGETTEDVQGVCAGNYKVTVTDAAGCSKVVSVNVTEPSKLKGQFTAYNPTTQYSCNGYIDFNYMQGGTGPYTYLWSNGDHTDDISGLCTGTYVVTVTDANGCTASGGVTLKTGGGVCNRNDYRGYGNNSENGGDEDEITLSSGVNKAEVNLISKSVYPNPSNGEFTVEFSVRNSSQMTVVLYDFAGNMVDVIFDGYVEADEIISTQFNESNRLSTGVYTIALKSEGNITYEKLIIN